MRYIAPSGLIISGIELTMTSDLLTESVQERPSRELRSVQWDPTKFRIQLGDWSENGRTLK